MADLFHTPDRAGRAQKVDQHQLDIVLSNLAGQLEQLQILQHASALALLRNQVIICSTKDLRRKQLLTVAIALEGTRLTQQMIDNMAVVQHQPAVAVAARQLQQQLAATVDLQLILIHLHFDLVANQSRRNRVAYLLNADRTARTDAAVDLVVIAQSCGRQLFHYRQFLRQLVGSCMISSTDHLQHERLIVGYTLEISTSTQQQMLTQAPFEMAVAGLHIPVLVGAANANRSGCQTVMLAQRHKVWIELALSAHPYPVRSGAAIIHAQLPWHFTQLVQAVLQTTTQRQQRLGEAHAGPVPVRIRQH